MAVGLQAEINVNGAISLCDQYFLYFQAGQMMLRTLLLLVLFILSNSSSTAFGQKTFYFDGPSLSIDVSDDQYAKLIELVNRLPFDKEINQLKDSVASSKRQLDQRLIEHKEQLESILTPDQLEVLNAKRKAKTQQNAKANANFMVQFAVFLAAFSKAEDLKIYEGIPWKVLKELDEDESLLATIEFGGALFYDEALPVQSSSLLEQLRSEIVDYRLYRPYNSEKWGRGSGSTPDFCIVWQDGKETHCVHIYLWGYTLVYFGPSNPNQLKFDPSTQLTFDFIASKNWMKFAATTSRQTSGKI